MTWFGFVWAHVIFAESNGKCAKRAAKKMACSQHADCILWQHSVLHEKVIFCGWKPRILPPCFASQSWQGLKMHCCADFSTDPTGFSKFYVGALMGFVPQHRLGAQNLLVPPHKIHWGRRTILRLHCFMCVPRRHSPFRISKATC